MYIIRKAMEYFKPKINRAYMNEALKKLSEKGKESQSGLLSAVKYWYDPTSPEQIGLAQPVKNLLTQFVRNYYG